MANKRKTERFTKRLGAEFTLGGGETRRGFTSNLSEDGLFIRSRRSFKEGSPVDIRITLPDGKRSCIKGMVRRSVTDGLGHSAKNGMGIEITHRDESYAGFLRGFGGGAGEEAAPPEKRYRYNEEKHCREEKRRDEERLHHEGKPWLLVLPCPACGTHNRVPAHKVSLGPRCGKCRAPLSPERDGGSEPEWPGTKAAKIYCAACGVRNRVRSDSLHLGPRCGRCREPLPTG